MQLHGYPAPPEGSPRATGTGASGPPRSVRGTPRPTAPGGGCPPTSERRPEPGSPFDWGGHLRRRNGGGRRCTARPRVAERQCAPHCQADVPSRDAAPCPRRERWSSHCPLHAGVPSVVVICGEPSPHTSDQSYARDNRLIPRWSSHPAGGLAHRCRLSPSSRCSRWEGSDCSSVKGLRELG